MGLLQRALFTAFLSAVFAVWGASTPALAGPSCVDCAKYSSSLDQHRQNHAEVKRLIDRNRSLLQSLQPHEQSKRIKINSNILISTVQLETIQNNLDALETWLKSNDCSACQAVSVPSPITLPPPPPPSNVSNASLAGSLPAPPPPLSQPSSPPPPQTTRPVDRVRKDDIQVIRTRKGARRHE